jgi:hypothetical protein
MKRNSYHNTVLLFHTACGGEDGFASFKLKDGEEVHWRLRPFSLTQVAAIDLVMRGGKRTLDLTPGREIAILPFIRCFAPGFPTPTRCVPRSPSSAIRASSARPSGSIHLPSGRVWTKPRAP